MKLGKCWHVILICGMALFASELTVAETNTKSIKLADPTKPDLTTTVVKKPKVLKKKKTLKKNPIKRMRLQQTLISKNRKLAIINGKLLSVGKWIHGAKVTSITPDYVVLKYQGKPYTLHLAYPKNIKEIKR